MPSDFCLDWLPPIRGTCYQPSQRVAAGRLARRSAVLRGEKAGWEYP